MKKMNAGWGMMVFCGIVVGFTGCDSGTEAAEATDGGGTNEPDDVGALADLTPSPGEECADSESCEGSLFINELAAKGVPLDWIELYNGTSDEVDLSLYWVADDLVDETKRVHFEDGTVLESGGYLRVDFDKNAWPGFKLGSDEEVGLWDMDGVLLDSVNWNQGESTAGMSLARIPDQTGSFQSVATPTPGEANPLE